MQSAPHSSLPDGPPHDDKAFGHRGSYRAWIVWSAVAVGFVCGAMWLFFPSDGTLSNADAMAQGGPRQSPRSAFDLGNLTVPRDLVRSGGPPVDGIPSLTHPKFVLGTQAGFLQGADRVIGIASGKVAKAYPLKILNYHEAVNDQVGGRPVLVTYCPLCDSVAVFDRRIGDNVLEFGISGLLYNSNVLLYDRGKRGARSLWSQLQATAVAGPLVGRKLQSLRFELTAWQDWLQRYPKTVVLSTSTGVPRDYRRSPYGPYFQTPRLMFPVRPIDRRHAPKERVLGVWTNNVARAYPLSLFGKGGQPQVFTDRIGDKQLTIKVNPGTGTFVVKQADEGIHWMNSLWFAWAAFHPDTEIFDARDKR